MHASISAAIIESMSDGLFVLDFQGYFRHINRAALQLLGLAANRIDGKTYLQVLISDPANDAFNDILFEGIQNRETRLYREVPFKNMRGEILELAVTTSFLRGTGESREEAGIVVVLKDITAAKALARARRRVVNHLSHELKTPLSIIAASLKTIESSNRQAALERIRRNLQRLQDIQTEVEDIVRTQRPRSEAKTLPWLNQILDLIELIAEEEPELTHSSNHLRDRIEAFLCDDGGEPADIDISRCIFELVRRVRRRSTHRDIVISASLEKNIGMRIAPEVFEKAVMGLLKNAVENTPNGGEILISLEQKPAAAVVEIKDTGIGITPESRRQIFDGFYYARDTNLYSTKRPYDFGAGGKGLDLLRLKVFGEIYHFEIECQSVRCRYIPEETDACPGEISACPRVQNQLQCARAGGSVFRLIFGNSSRIYAVASDEMPEVRESP